MFGLSVFTTKIILLSLGVVVLAGTGFGVYKYINSGNNAAGNSVEEKITGSQASGQNVEVSDASLGAYAVSFAGNSDTIDAGYIATPSVRLLSTKKMTKIAIEELKINDFDAPGFCDKSEEDAIPGIFSSGAQQMGTATFKLSCHTGVTYSQRDVLSSTGAYDGAKMLSYGGLTPAALARTLSFDIAIKFDDGTMTKKTFNGTISGQKLWNGDFGAGSLTGKGDKF